ncbi:MAG TPA: hypothetical protein PLZ93_14730 [Nocardioides sp.]|uniref:hypothetical protein n=1 Tax=uncultured Nocardioides sp. TaxID=198441 RepID=UPI000ED38C94|nr:hypothetical protein [uncultured Nocardioides sp.]HCB04125.1 hypothetical protein [Nocardioides sp.]HRD63653.1 hypothetical protein [Nocardioides sp.]HRI96869.1 hypothetical protein [Nocardioides sp.]
MDGRQHLGAAARPDLSFVCPPAWDLTPTEYAELVLATDGPWAAHRVAVASALSAAAIGAYAVVADYLEWLPITLAVLCILGSLWATVAAFRVRREMAEVSDEATIDLSRAPADQLALVDAAVKCLPTRRQAARSVTAAAAREQGLTSLWQLARDIDHARREDREAATSTLSARWAAAGVRYESVMAEWGTIASDPLAALEHAALLDVTRPRTTLFIEALGKAQDRRAILGEAVPLDAHDIVEFEELTQALSTAWNDARHQAAHLGYAWLPEPDLARAVRAERLLRLACDSGAAPAERATAAERAAKLLREIGTLVLPEPAQEILAATMRRELG